VSRAEQFAVLRDLYERLVELPVEARAAVLAELAVPAALAAVVLALCAAGDRDHTQALTPARDQLLGDLAEPGLQPGDVLGAWQITARIGGGGMGQVYRVERSDGHYRQQAALKFIRGLAPSAARSLFHRERQVLARLRHPGIARLIDGGESPGGQPYLVMEYVEGQQIDVWCRQHARSRDRILDLFGTTCAAVGHAHRQLVVHCDLKPANILVDAEGRPVLLDFGIAQLNDRMAHDADSMAALAFTPGYASPEQMAGERVGTASDIFSLGVLLEALLRESGVRRDRELQAIIDKATRADPVARYASVDALCEDITRMRQLRPVSALPQRAGYRLSRFVRRRWAPLLAAGLILLMITGFTWAVIEEGQRARAAETSALAERDRALLAESQARAAETSARETSGFLISVFREGNPDAGGGTVSLASLLDAALLRVDTDLADIPGTQSHFLSTLAQVLFVIGQPDRGHRLYARAIELERAQRRPLVLAEMLIGNAHELRRDRAALVDPAAVLEALQLIESHAARGSPQHLDLRITAASILGQLRRPEAAAVFEATVQEAREHHAGSLALASALAAYGWHLRRLSDYDGAIALMREALDLRRLRQGDAHVDFAAQLESLAGTLQLARRFAEAEPLFDQALALHRREGRLQSRLGAWSQVQYGTMLSAAGRAHEALPLFEEAFAIGRQKLPDDSPTFRVWRSNFAEAVAATGDVPRAVELIDRALAAARVEAKPGGLGLARTLILKARTLGQNGCDAGAGTAVDEALKLLSVAADDNAFDLADAQAVRTQWLIDCRQIAAAQSQLALLEAQPQPPRPNTRMRLPYLAAQLGLWRDGNAEALAALVDAEQLLAARYEPGDCRAALARLPRAEWLHAHQRWTESADLARAMEAEIGHALVPQAALRRRLAALQAAP